MTSVKDFLIRDLFDISTGSLLKIKDVPDGSIPRISVRSDNNGILGYYDTEGNPDARHAENFISVNFFGNAFYHPYRASLEMKVHCLTLKACELTESLGLYLVTALNKVFAQQGYSYGEQLSSSDLKTQDLKISLPVTTVAMPDWAALETLLKVHGGGAEMSKIDTSSWKKFKISELFGNAKLGKYHNPTDLYPDSNGYDFICASNLNNGINKDMPKVNGENLSLTPPNIIAWGKQCPMFTYHQNPCVTSQGMYYIELPEAVTEEMALFIITLLEYACSGNYGYNNCLIGSKFDDLEISLPVTMKDVPDWDYMQERIAELEQERIAELEQYLVAAGLNDYTLTENDLKVLSLSGSGRNEDGNPAAHAAVPKPMKEFQMDNIVDVLTPKQRFNANTVSIDKYRKKGYAYVVRTSENNGIRGNIEADESYLNDARTFSFGQDTATIFWQIEPYFTGDKIKVLKPKYCLTDEMAQYIMTSIRQAFSHFVWGQQSFSEKVICKMMIILPIQTDESGAPVIDEAKAYHPDGYVPDWEYMAAYIRAMEKLVIRDVVDYKDEFIRQHKLAVAGSGV